MGRAGRAPVGGVALGVDDAVQAVMAGLLRRPGDAEDAHLAGGQVLEGDEAQVGRTGLAGPADARAIPVEAHLARGGGVAPVADADVDGVLREGDGILVHQAAVGIVADPDVGGDPVGRVAGDIARVGFVVPGPHVGLAAGQGRTGAGEGVVGRFGVSRELALAGEGVGAAGRWRPVGELDQGVGCGRDTGAVRTLAVDLDAAAGPYRAGHGYLILGQVAAVEQVGADVDRQAQPDVGARRGADDGHVVAGWLAGELVVAHVGLGAPRAIAVVGPRLLVDVVIDRVGRVGGVDAGAGWRQVVVGRGPIHELGIGGEVAGPGALQVRRFDGAGGAGLARQVGAPVEVEDAVQDVGGRRPGYDQATWAIPALVGGDRRLAEVEACSRPQGAGPAVVSGDEGVGQGQDRALGHLHPAHAVLQRDVILDPQPVAGEAGATRQPDGGGALRPVLPDLDVLQDELCRRAGVESRTRVGGVALDQHLGQAGDGAILEPQAAPEPQATQSRGLSLVAPDGNALQGHGAAVAAQAALGVIGRIALYEAIGIVQRAASVHADAAVRRAGRVAQQVGVLQEGGCPVRDGHAATMIPGVVADQAVGGGEGGVRLQANAPTQPPRVLVVAHDAVHQRHGRSLFHTQSAPTLGSVADDLGVADQHGGRTGDKNAAARVGQALVVGNRAVGDGRRDAIYGDATLAIRAGDGKAIQHRAVAAAQELENRLAPGAKPARLQDRIGILVPGDAIAGGRKPDARLAVEQGRCVVKDRRAIPQVVRRTVEPDGMVAHAILVPGARRALQHRVAAIFGPGQPIGAGGVADAPRAVAGTAAVPHPEGRAVEQDRRVCDRDLVPGFWPGGQHRILGATGPDQSVRAGGAADLHRAGIAPGGTLVVHPVGAIPVHNDAGIAHPVRFPGAVKEWAQAGVGLLVPEQTVVRPGGPDALLARPPVPHPVSVPFQAHERLVGRQ